MQAFLNARKSLGGHAKNSVTLLSLKLLNFIFQVNVGQNAKQMFHILC